jgi:hypothetical protein
MARSLGSDLLAQAGPIEGAFTIDEFCRAFRISRSMFYKLRKNGQAPVVMDAGKPLISFAAAAEWRRTRETQASASAE